MPPYMKSILCLVGCFTGIFAGARLVSAVSDRLNGNAEAKQSLTRILADTTDQSERREILELIGQL